jgi:hypothetical protein
MLISNYKVFITKNGDGAITYTKNNVKYKVFISKNNDDLIKIFDTYFKRLQSFKNRHYIIAQWIVRDIRATGYSFKAYANNNTHIRPIVKCKFVTKTEKPISEDLESTYFHRYTTEMYRMIH